MKNIADPIVLFNCWLEDEAKAGVPNPQQAVLCTASNERVGHGRVVAIREVNTDGLLFFTQKGTRKCAELANNPEASLVFWFELQQREVIFEGEVVALGEAENQHYWESYSPEAQLRFHSYAATSTQPIASKQVLEDLKNRLKHHFWSDTIPMSEHYLGFRLKARRVVFYAYRVDELSDIVEYRQAGKQWLRSYLSP